MAINRVSAAGNLTRDAELRKTQDGLAVLNFTIAINEKRKNPETGKYDIDAPVYARCAMFGTRAERIAQYLTKGTKLFIEGKLRYSTYVKDDEKRSALSVLVTEVEFAGSKPKQDGAEVDDAPVPEQAAPDLYDEDIPF